MKIKLVEYIGRIQDGGAETLVKDYALLLNKDIFDVIILCDDYVKTSANYRILKENNITVIDMFEKHAFVCKILRRIFAGKFRALLFDKAISKIKPDVIHVHLESLNTLRYSKKLEGIKLLYTCHNPAEIMIGSGNPVEHEAAQYLLENYGMRFIGLHSDMAKDINDMFGIDNTAVIKNGINLDRFRNVNISRTQKRKELGIPEDAYVIGNNGRFSYQKNHKFMIKVFNEVYKKNKKAFLVLVGRGKLEDKIRSQIKQLGLEHRTLILSQRKDVDEILKTMDVFLFASRFEGLGIVLIEAQAVGLPCVVSDAIPKEAFQSNLITRLSLDETLEKWANTCLNPISNVFEYGDINDYDMVKVVHELEKLYTK